jgi:very-short-patch-repair endonuclease
MRASPLPPELRSGPFSVANARASGIGPPRLRRSDLRRPHHGIRVSGGKAPTDVAERCRELFPALPDAAVFSHTTAAQLLGLPLPGWAQTDAIHVAVPPPLRAPRRDGVIGHQLMVDESIEVDGLPVAPPVETWVQLAALLRVDDLVLAGDALVRRHEPLARMSSLEQATTAASGRPGIRRLREAQPLVRARTDSPMETVLRLRILRSGLPEPTVNHVIHARDRSYHADLAYPGENLAIEYDGDQHRTDAAQYHVDVDRLWAIESAGWRVLRLNRTHLQGDGRIAVARIRSALKTSWRNTPPTIR